MIEQIVLDLVGRIYDAAGDPRLWPAFLDKFADAVGGTTTHMMVYDLERLNGNVSAVVRVDPESLRKYDEYYNQIDCWAVNGRPLLKTGATLSGQMLCEDRILQRSEFYADFLRPLDHFHHCCGVIRNEGAVLSVIASLRPQRAGAFSDQELHLLSALMPHLHRAIQLHQKIVDLQVTADSAEETINRFRIGVLIANVKGGIVMLNQSARRIVDQKDGLVLTRDGLSTLWPEQTQQLRSMVQGAARAASGSGIESGGAMTITRASMRRAYQLLVAPLRRGAAWCGIDMPAAAIFVSDPEAEAQGVDQILACLFGLTPAEARLASMLMQGKSLEQAAETFELTRNTVRSQLQTIFEKTGTSRQGELIRLLLNSPAQLRFD